MNLNLHKAVPEQRNPMSDPRLPETIADLSGDEKCKPSVWVYRLSEIELILH